MITDAPMPVIAPLLLVNEYGVMNMCCKHLYMAGHYESIAPHTHTQSTLVLTHTKNF